jgi:hypothetical protein
VRQSLVGLQHSGVLQTTRPLDCEPATTIVSLSVGVKVLRNEHDEQPRFRVLKNTCCATIACRGYSIGRLAQLCHYYRESADTIDALRVGMYAEKGLPYHLVECAVLDQPPFVTIACPDRPWRYVSQPDFLMIAS